MIKHFLHNPCYPRDLRVLDGDADRDRDADDLFRVSNDFVRRGTALASDVYLQNCGDILHRGDRRVAVHLQVRAKSPLGVGFG